MVQNISKKPAHLVSIRVKVARYWNSKQFKVVSQSERQCSRAKVTSELEASDTHVYNMYVPLVTSGDQWHTSRFNVWSLWHRLSIHHL